jgi:hypothetical protein
MISGGHDIRYLCTQYKYVFVTHAHAKSITAPDYGPRITCDHNKKILGKCVYKAL